MLSVPMIDLDRVVVFIPFGARLANGVLNPAYDFQTNGRGLDVRAVAPGVVSRVGANEGIPDFEVHVKPSATSGYFVIYDHVLPPMVAEGAVVAAGDRLGTIGNGNPGWGKIELQINRRGSPDVSLCPRDLGTAAFNAAHAAALAATQSPHADVCLAPTVIP